MTNGEKIKEIFPNRVLTSINNSYYWGDDILVGKSFWNAEYKEPNKSEIPTGSTTKNDLGVDCISRQELLKIYEDRFSELQKLKHLKDNKGAEDRQMGVNYCINILKELPPATPQEPRWIPISEKTPDKGGEYLLWGKIDESEEENYCFIGDYHEFDEVFGVEISKYDSKTLGFIDTEIEEYYSVVAWMPLPKPYREVEE